MASKAKKINPIQKGIKTVNAQVHNLNKEAVNISNEIVSETIATGKQWQNLLAKGLKGGTHLFGQQQDIVLTTLESLKGQFLTRNYRLRKLFSFDFKFSTPERIATIPTSKRTVKTKTKKAVAIKTTAPKAKVIAKKTTAPKAKVAAKKAVAIKTTAPKAKITAKKTVAIKTTTPKAKVVAKKTTAPKVKVAAKKVVTKKITTATTKNNLRIIEGIGPKIEELLNKGGINTFLQLENAKMMTLLNILEAAGSRFRMHDPATWSTQAGLAAAGKMEELKKWQADLKGGKVAKK